MSDTVTVVPWKHDVLREWSIVGMNHYHVKGVKHLYVALVKGPDYIKAEGLDTKAVWDDLIAQARRLNLDETRRTNR